MRRPGSRLTLTTGLLAALLIMPSAALAEPATRSIATDDGAGTGELRISTATAKPHARATAASTVSVAVLDFLFDPQDITVSAGDTVSWTNEGEKKHDVDGDGFESETLETGDSYSFTFSDPGTFDYICGIHPKMKATVTVAGTPSDPEPPAGKDDEDDAGTTDSGTESRSAGDDDGASDEDGSGENKSDESGGGVSSGGEPGGGGEGDGSGGSLPSTGQDLLPPIMLAELLLIGGLALRLRLA